MSIEERVGQLVMAPLYAGTDPSALYDLIANQHVGSVLIIGNWWSGTAGVRPGHPMSCSHTRRPITGC